MNRGLASLCLAVCIAWMPQSALAVIISCSLDTNGTAVSFGDYDHLFSFPKDDFGTFKVSCTGTLGGTADVYLSAGLSGTYTARTMKKGTDTLFYNLYINEARDIVWAPDNSGAHQSFNCGAACTPLSPTTFTIYGRIPAHQNVPVGSYSDIITITVSW